MAATSFKLDTDFISKANFLGKQKRPFLFIINFKGNKTIIQEEKKTDILFDVNGVKNFDYQKIEKKLKWEVKGPEYAEYQAAFNFVQTNQNLGNSYLTNLTFPSKIETNLSLEEIFHLSNAKYKLWVNHKFVVFSPETFIKIQDNFIFSYPMKGTISASIKNAQQQILNDEKEIAEHYTIVDLIRNDLSQVAKKVQVTKLRFIDEIVTQNDRLYQVSSEIKGELNHDWSDNLGTLIEKLLPAGSITGAPKLKTVQIIHEAENYDRDFYTGIFGYFDGENLDTGVMIRYLENQNGNFVYKSGGGITAMSDCKKEYNELIQKIYVPFC